MIAAFSFRDPNFIDSAYLVASVLFILGIRGLSHPRTARQGNRIAAIGMAIAIVATLLDREIQQLRADHPRDRDRHCHRRLLGRAW